MLPLFAYGTLRDPEYQRELFGRTYPMQPARVTGYVVMSTGGGYLAATERSGATIDGILVHLDARGYAIADAWEDLTVYARRETDARSDGGIVRAFIYVQSQPGGTPIADDRIANRSRADVIADIRSFRESATAQDRW